MTQKLPISSTIDSLYSVDVLPNSYRINYQTRKSSNHVGNDIVSLFLDNGWNRDFGLSQASWIHARAVIEAFAGINWRGMFQNNNKS